MAPHSSTPAWIIPWTEEHGRLQSMGLLRIRHDWVTSRSLSHIGEGNGDPLQCSCLENPMDGRAWKAAVHGVGHDRATSLSLFTFMHWRRKWQPTPVFLPGESQGRGAWWAAIYGVAQSWTWLKWLSSSSSKFEMYNSVGLIYLYTTIWLLG